MDFDLQKKAAKVNQFLLDKGIKKAPIMRVAVALDISGSMGHLYRSSPSPVQLAFNQLMGVSVKFDDNGELDVFKFDDRCEYVDTSKPVKGDYDVFINKHGIGARGGTNYAPIVDEAVNFFFEPSPAVAAQPEKKGFLGFGKSAAVPAQAEGAVDNTPVLMMIVTDGEPSDKAEVQRRMQAVEAAGHPIYFHMVGIGGTRRDFPTIAKLADALDNVGEVYLPNLEMTDDEIYSQLICDELLEFVAKHAPAAQTATV